MKRFLVLAMVFIACPTWAQCWKVENLRGYSAAASDHYKFIEDGFTGKKFYINITAKKADLETSGTGSDLDYIPISATSMVGMYTIDTKQTIETWMVNGDKAFMTRVRQGMGGLDATMAFVGDVTGKC